MDDKMKAFSVGMIYLLAMSFIAYNLAMKCATPGDFGGLGIVAAGVGFPLAAIVYYLTHKGHE